MYVHLLPGEDVVVAAALGLGLVEGVAEAGDEAEQFRAVGARGAAHHLEHPLARHAHRDGVGDILIHRHAGLVVEDDAARQEGERREQQGAECVRALNHESSGISCVTATSITMSSSSKNTTTMSVMAST